MNKNIAIGALVIVIAAGAYYLYSGNSTTLPNGDTGEQGAVTSGKHVVNWKFDDVGEDPVALAPRTKVTVTWDGKSYDAGTYLGSCSEIGDNNALTLQENEVSGALCWWAGSGDELGIYNENGTFILKHGDQQESSADSQGFRGNFKTIVIL